MSQIAIDDIATDDETLEKKVEELIGCKVGIDKTYATTADPQALDTSIRALLVKRDGGEGAIRVSNGLYLPTGPKEEPGYVIVSRDAEQICVLFGQPSVRLFREVQAKDSAKP